MQHFTLLDTAKRCIFRTVFTIATAKDLVIAAVDIGFASSARSQKKMTFGRFLSAHSLHRTTFAEAKDLIVAP